MSENNDDENGEAKQDDESIIKKARAFLKLAKDAEQENRDRYIEDISFGRLGEQWPDKIRQDRDKEGRPCLTFNKIPAFNRQVINDSRQNKPSIKVLPVGTDSDKATAQILEGIIRNIEVQSNADVAYDTAIDNAVSGNIGYIRVKLDYAHNDSFDLDIDIDQVPNPLAIYADPHSKKSDSADWNQALVIDWMSLEAFEEKYPDADPSGFDDEESDDDWITDHEIALAEYWEREESEEIIVQLSNGSVVSKKHYEAAQEEYAQFQITAANEKPAKTYKVTQYLMTGAEILETNPWPGMYIPIIPVYGEEVNVNGKRQLYSLAHHAHDAQRSYNYWRTSAVEKVALDTKTPWIVAEGSTDDDPNWQTANVKNHPFLKVSKNSPWQPYRTPAGGVPAGDLQLAMNAADDMKSIIGIYDASLGARSNETSGKAIMARQREGDIATFHFIDNMSRAIRHLGLVVVDLIPKVYNKARMVRTLREDGDPEAVQINQAFLDNGIERIYDLTSGKYDVVIKSGPSFTSKREEAAQQMIQFAQSMPQSAALIGDFIAKNLDWPNSDEIADRIKNMLPPQALGQQGQPQIPPELQQQIQQVQEQVAQGQQAMAQLQQENQELKLQAQNKAGELEIKAKEIEIKEKELALRQVELQADLVEKQAEYQHKAHMMNNPMPVTEDSVYG